MNSFNALIGQSPNFESLLRSARMVAGTDVTVLIAGETGTGKEVLAKAIQSSSPRADKSFVSLNCAALPEGIVESELFGHRKGAFTGAIANKIGLFQAADGGTLFLDEIDSLPLPIQAKLLRFLEGGECQPVGETRTFRLDVRIIAASNADLQKKIASGEFRQDLFYRLNVVPLELPPLRNRRSDIEHLLTNFIETFAAEYKLAPPRLSKAALKQLHTYAWPGNIRELRNVCERLSILMPGKTIEPENLPLEVGRVPTPNRANGFTLPEMGLNLEALEVDLIHQALNRTNGNRSKSARLLGISRDTLLYRIQKHGIASH
ncbi:MAG: sigma-54 dependent transcriptional regulator [Pseudomonadota bacterium]